MSHESLAVYLHDHRAGAVAAVELLNQLERTHAQTAIARFAADVRAEINADVEVLEGLMDRLAIGTSRPREAAAWLTAKVADLKMRFDDEGDGALRLLETVEALALGIDGKHALWISLAAAAEHVPLLAGVDYERLLRRAKAQRRTVEVQRLSAVKAAFGTASSAG